MMMVCLADTTLLTKDERLRDTQQENRPRRTSTMEGCLCRVGCAGWGGRVSGVVSASSCVMLERQEASR